MWNFDFDVMKSLVTKQVQNHQVFLKNCKKVEKLIKLT